MPPGISGVGLAVDLRACIYTNKVIFALGDIESRTIRGGFGNHLTGIWINRLNHEDIQIAWCGSLDERSIRLELRSMARADEFNFLVAPVIQTSQMGTDFIYGFDTFFGIRQPEFHFWKIDRGRPDCRKLGELPYSEKTAKFPFSKTGHGEEIGYPSDINKEEAQCCQPG